MKFSERTNWFTGENRLMKRAAELRGSPGFIDLTETNPTRCGFQYLSPALLAPFTDPKNLSYDPHPKGLLEAREAIAAYYAQKNVRVPPEDIFLTAGTSEAYGFLFDLLADPGDAVMAPRPGYPLFDHLADLHAVRLEKYAHLKSIGAQLGTKIRALIAIHPNNPTGFFVGESERKELFRICRERNIALIADEVFLDFAWGSSKTPRSFADKPEVLTFVLSGVSKILGLPQMKLSWVLVAGPEEAKRHAIERLEVIADAYLSVGAPSQRALAAWFGRSRQIAGEILDRVVQNRAFLSKRLLLHKDLKLLEAEGGWASVVQFSANKSDEEIAFSLLERHKILVHPGYLFDFDEENHLVLSLLLKPDDFSRGVDLLLKF